MGMYQVLQMEFALYIDTKSISQQHKFLNKGKKGMSKGMSQVFSLRVMANSPRVRSFPTRMDE